GERDRDDLIDALRQIQRGADYGASEDRSRTGFDHRVRSTSAIENVAPEVARQEVIARAAFYVVVAVSAVERDRTERESGGIDGVRAVAPGDRRLLDATDR